ncbi:MAG TPA: type 2 isopentenyl-diphosphate Delta-isomerase [Bacillota bacterium]|jgi:isopentenyl-diphosphate delta-isomerase|nr:type 2 isopentenyl-diphosphate Delta-isomerase [Bacillota bacterium]HOA35783.1 type 2 isopentenyl-diphosphate Delta-isomerase [Bacillota bacterium]HOJ84274.1 type 2 isopentenyl-diphosphate Delta-isomerase [Bacillota bacterium]HOL14662.1 type 2 isopentenyl-diphosphate Delta-isomerase [Bacillota bacterium]HPZ11066.1 type 2 isopentenyl-diphosphate Delta-isomerase [Bacillota bacterium]
MGRLSRKDEHIIILLKQRPGLADFSDIHFVHNCLPERDLDEVTLETSLLGRKLGSPLFINALTGGTPLSKRVNAALAGVARDCGLAMALGSQMAALDDPLVEDTFKVVREVYPEGLIWANLGSYATPELARRAIEMVDAAALQIHLNVPQELAMREGDCRFRGTLRRIKEIAAAVERPVIVKEVGFGIAREQAKLLIEAGAAAIDVSGRGGTNFMAIEGRRSRRPLSPEFLTWGLPTAVSLLEVLDAAAGKAEVIASGGMFSSLNIAKALALGAQAVGIAGYPLYLLIKRGRRALFREIRRIERELRHILLMTGSASLEELRQVPLVITGFTGEWMKQRNLRHPRKEVGGQKSEVGGD